MSFREEVQAVHEIKAKDPYKFRAYDLRANHHTKTYRLALFYVQRELSDGQTISHTQILHFSSHKKALDAAINAPKQLTAEEVKNNERN